MSKIDERGKVVEVLRGHTTAETAVVVEDYPHGGHYRVKMRYWIETAEKGQYRGQQRLTRQSTNPRETGEVWFKPQPGRYGNWLMFLVRYENGQVDGVGFSTFFSGDSWVEFYLTGIWAHLDTDERQRVATWVAKYRTSNPNSWAEWDARTDAMRKLSLPKLEEWRSLEQGKYVDGERYEKLRNYLEIGGPDLRQSGVLA